MNLNTLWWLLGLLLFVAVPMAFVVSIRYIFKQEHWYFFLLGGILGAVAILFFGWPILSMLLGFEVGVCYLSFFKPPTLRRVGAAFGWAAGVMLGMSATKLLGGPYAQWDEESGLAGDLFIFGPIGGLMGAMLGLAFGRFYQRGKSRQIRGVRNAFSHDSINPMENTAREVEHEK